VKIFSYSHYFFPILTISSIPNHSSQDKTDFLHSEPFLLGQNRLPPFLAILFKPKPTSSIPSNASQDKTDFLYSKPFQSGQNQLPPFQDIPVRTKPTSSILSHSSRARTNFFYFNFQAIPVQPEPITYIPNIRSSQNRLSPFQAIPVKTEPTFYILSHFSQAKTDFLHSKLFQSSQNRRHL
jgi:hypothetical protein